VADCGVRDTSCDHVEFSVPSCVLMAGDLSWGPDGDGVTPPALLFVSFSIFL